MAARYACPLVRNIGVLSAMAALFLLAGTAAADCPPSSPNPCFNAPAHSGTAGTASVCCPGSCGPSAGNNGEVATCASSGAGSPTPTVSVYAFFNESLPEATCKGYPTAPSGGGFEFGDVCTFYIPALDPATNGTVGNIVYLENTFLCEGTDCLQQTTHTLYLGPISGKGVPADSLTVTGVSSNYEFLLPIIAGTGKYLGAKGYYISRRPVVWTREPDFTAIIQKDFYVTGYY